MKDRILFVSGLLILCAATLLLSRDVRRQAGLPRPQETKSATRIPAAPVPQNQRRLYPVSQENLWGYIDQTGTMVIPPVYNMAFEFHEGLAHVLVNGLWGYIDESGRMVIKPQFARADRFYEGFARVSFDPEGNQFPGFIDRTGKLVIDTEGAQYLGNFSEGLASIQMEGRFGYINTRGDFVIQPRFDVADSFAEGLAKVAVQTETGYLWGFIDRKGEVKIPLQYEDVGSFSEGLASVRTGDLFGYIDATGNFVIPPQFEYAGDFSSGLAPIVRVKFGYCDRTGSIVIQPRYDLASPFNGNLAAVAMESPKGPLWGFIGRNGEFVVQPQFDNVGGMTGGAGLDGGVSQVTIGDHVGYVDATGKYIWQPCYNCNKKP